MLSPVRLSTKYHKLTAYALACGYVERKGEGDNRTVLDRENGCYHVKGFTNGKHFWESFGTLTAARKFYSGCLKAGTK